MKDYIYLLCYIFYLIGIDILMVDRRPAGIPLAGAIFTQVILNILALLLARWTYKKFMKGGQDERQ